jgi:hypothetical protein
MKKPILKITQVANIMIAVNLILSPVALAENNKPAASQVISSVLSDLGSVTTQNQQQNQMNMQQQVELAALQQVKLAPVADKMFPACQMLPVISASIDKYCKNQSDPMVIDQYLKVATFNASEYEKFLATGQEGRNQGIQCLTEEKKKFNALLDRRELILQNMIANLETENNAAKSDLEKNKNLIKEYKGILDGGDGLALSAKSKDFTSVLADPACKSVLKPEDLTSGKSNLGLRTLKANVESQGLNSAASFMKSKSNIETEIKAQATAASNFFTKQGIHQLGDVNSLQLPNLTALGGDNAIKESLKPSLIEYHKKFEELKDKMANEAGINFPKKFSKETIKSQLARDIENKKKNDMLDCALEGDIKSVLSSVEQRAAGVDKSSMTVRSFKKKIDPILKNKDNLSIDQLIEQISNVEKGFAQDKDRGLTVRYDSTYSAEVGKDYPWFPSELLQRIKQSCNNRFKTLTDSSTGMTKEQSYTKAYALVDEYDKIDAKAAQDFSKAITDRMLDCKGINVSQTPETCNSKGILETKSANFCMKAATECSTNILACHDKVNAAVKQVQGKMQAQADVYNAKVDARIKALKVGLTNIKQQFIAMGSQLKALYPTSEFEFPEKAGTFDIKMPNPEMDKDLEVALSSTDSFDEVIENLKAVQEKVKKQKASVIAEVDKRIDKFNGQLENQKSKWEELVSRCEGLQKSIAEQMQKANDEKAKADTERNKDLSNFCYQARKARYSPGCDEMAEDLASSTEKVAAYLNPETIDQVGDFESYCMGQADEAVDISVSDVTTWCAGTGKDDKNCEKLKVRLAEIDKEYVSQTNASGQAIEVVHVICGKNDSKEKCIEGDDSFKKAKTAYKTSKGVKKEVGENDRLEIAECDQVNTNGANVGKTPGAAGTINDIMKILQQGSKVNY